MTDIGHTMYCLNCGTDLYTVDDKVKDGDNLTAAACTPIGDARLPIDGQGVYCHVCKDYIFARYK